LDQGVPASRRAIVTARQYFQGRSVYRQPDCFVRRIKNAHRRHLPRGSADRGWTQKPIWKIGTKLSAVMPRRTPMSTKN